MSVFMKYTVDESECIGCGLCAGVCSDIFTLDNDHRAEAADVDDADGAEAMKQCPVGAIKEKKK